MIHTSIESSPILSAWGRKSFEHVVVFSDEDGEATFGPRCGIAHAADIDYMECEVASRWVIVNVPRAESEPVSESTDEHVPNIRLLPPTDEHAEALFDALGDWLTEEVPQPDAPFGSGRTVPRHQLYGDPFMDMQLRSRVPALAKELTEVDVHDGEAIAALLYMNIPEGRERFLAAVEAVSKTLEGTDDVERDEKGRPLDVTTKQPCVPHPGLNRYDDEGNLWACPRCGVEFVPKEVSSAPPEGEFDRVPAGWFDEARQLVSQSREALWVVGKRDFLNKLASFLNATEEWRSRSSQTPEAE